MVFIHTLKGRIVKFLKWVKITKTFPCGETPSLCIERKKVVFYFLSPTTSESHASLFSIFIHCSFFFLFSLPSFEAK
ncbi:hypothetical protein VNO77_44791 [Canavalia gladiata]|uniref:Uncharacterized protein n=1 Tax=Canavalia gladiata TaxID=3824 RepID=A0AAN9PQM4_CANGL